jgi:glycerophosphoryl diester phosphodiesterase
VSQASSGIPSKPAWPYPRFIAHRGAGKIAPENTLAAMRAGHARGYRMVEFDVKLSADGVAFLLHDDTLDRTTTGSGPADALTWAELSKLDAGRWRSPVFAGERLPTLADTAQWAIANDVACNVEIKPMPGRDVATGRSVALDAVLLWKGARIQPLLSSFSEAALDAARSVAPQLLRAMLYEDVPANWKDQLARLECAAIDTDYRKLDAALVVAAHRAGYRVLAYTPNDPASVGRLVSWKVDGIITDAIDVIQPE